MMSNKISDYQNTGDAIGLAKIGGEPFTIVAVQDSTYDDKPSLIISTKKPITVEGVEYTNFYTSRKTLLETLKQDSVRADLKAGKTIGPVKCSLVAAKGGGKDYWVLEDA